MYEKIAAMLQEQGYNMDKVYGVFVSAFDAPDKLLWSGGSMTPRMSLGQQIKEIIADGGVEPAYVIVDMVDDYKEMSNPQAILQISPKQYGFALITMDETQQGVLLPHTAGIADAKSALRAIKEKYEFTSMKVRVFVFTTKRFALRLDEDSA